MNVREPVEDYDYTSPRRVDYDLPISHSKNDDCQYTIWVAHLTNGRAGFYPRFGAGLTRRAIDAYRWNTANEVRSFLVDACFSECVARVIPPEELAMYDTMED